MKLRVLLSLISALLVALPVTLVSDEISSMDEIAEESGSQISSELPQVPQNDVEVDKTEHTPPDATDEYSEDQLQGSEPDAEAEPERETPNVEQHQKKRIKTSGAAPAQEFADVPKNHQFYEEIVWMKEQGLTTGTKKGNKVFFNPKYRLTREAMAAFMFRQFAPAQYNAPRSTYFTDVPTSHKFFREISWMYEAGLTTGIKNSDGSKRYSPAQQISREAMAAFVYRQFAHGAAVDPGLSPFLDVKPGDPFYKEILWMYTSGRTTGISVGNSRLEYWPKNSLSREAAAAFLYRTSFPVDNPPLIKEIITGSLVITGSGRIGETLTATTSAWQPSETTFSYQWKRNGLPINNAHKRTFVPGPNDLGTNISVVVYADVQGYLSATKESDQKIIVAGQSSTSGFKAGNIIADAKFYDGEAMSVQEIQTFLERMVPTCRIGSTGYEVGKKWGNTVIASACLPQATFFSHGDPANDACRGLARKTNESAAEIIHRVGKACGVSQKALIVMLQKEQSLITDTWPTQRQYDVAMGYGCPDTGPNYSANCNPAYVGFYEQVSWAAWQLKDYAQRPAKYRHQAGKTHSIQYHPNPDCGTSAVHIVNDATAGLYNYTPYVPNTAALQAGLGTGNSCSAYGNRNFYLRYTQWFGPVHE